MRVIVGAVLLLLLLLSNPANGQTLVLHGAMGPTIIDSGQSLAAGIGITPHPLLTVLFSVDRTHLAGRITRDAFGRVSTAFRGGTSTLATAELRATLFRRERLSPYVVGGLGAGVSQPNVNEVFPQPVTNYAQVVFFGGGLHVPLPARMSAFGDFRMLLGAEGREGMMAFAPVRAGLTWRF